MLFQSLICFFFQAEDGIRDLVRSRGLGDVYKRQAIPPANTASTLLKTKDRIFIATDRLVVSNLKDRSFYRHSSTEKRCLQVNA